MKVSLIEQEKVMTESASQADWSQDPVLRPTAHRWLWYALGGGLPARHRGWVLHDTTTRTWGYRHVARSMVQMTIPIVLVMTLVPAGWGLRAAVAGGGVFLGLLYSLAYMPETTEHRIVKAGYPAGLATAIRDRAGTDKQHAETERKHAAAAKRTARYQKRAGR